MQEIWKTIPNYENYQVSNLGNVRSLYFNNSKKLNIKNLHPRTSRRGYYEVELTNTTHTMKKLLSIHRLVALAFIPNPDNLPLVNHKDENKTNNCVENLEWCTQVYNINYGSGKARALQNRTGKNACKKIRCIETNIIYDSINDASRKTGLDRSGLCGCCRGKYKTCGKLHWEYI